MCIYITPYADFLKQTPKEPWGPSSFLPCKAAGSLLITGKTPWSGAGNLGFCAFILELQLLF